LRATARWSARARGRCGLGCGSRGEIGAGLGREIGANFFTGNLRIFRSRKPLELLADFAISLLLRNREFLRA
jgi:hypothetical protein